jgi:hypothetical protein
MTREQELILIDAAIAEGRCKVIAGEEVLAHNEEVAAAWQKLHHRRFNGWDKGDRGGSATSSRFREKRLKKEGLA